MVKVLFVCKHNRFRSKVAEAIFNHLNENSVNESRSRGMVRRDVDEFVAEKTIQVMGEKGYTIGNTKAKLINSKDIEWTDKIIIVADNASSAGFPREKTAVWGIQDCSEFDEARIVDRVNEIELKVKELLKTLY